MLVQFRGWCAGEQCALQLEYAESWQNCCHYLNAPCPMSRKTT
jgi:hypothetical protein